MRIRQRRVLLIVGFWRGFRSVLSSPRQLFHEFLRLECTFACALYFAILVLAPQNSRAQDCQTLPQPKIVAVGSSGSAFDSAWASDTSFTIVKRERDGGRKSYRITGDIVRFDEQSFGSLARERPQRFSDLAEIVIDAREIYFDGPLALNMGRIELLADHITFGPRAQIVFTDPEPSSVSPVADSDQSILLPRGRGIAIVARRIDFDHPLPYLFYFATHKNRDLQILAEKIFLNGDRIEQPDRFILDHSLGHSILEGSPTVVHRAKARNLYRLIFRREMNWPVSFSNKIARLHARAPYQQDFIDGIRNRISSYQPLISDWRDPGPSLRLLDISAFLDAGLDPYGYGPNYVPRNDLDAQTRTVDDLLNNFRDKGALELVESTILKAYVSERPDEKALQAIFKKELALESDTSKNEAAMNQALTDIQVLQQKIDTQLVAINVSIDRIKAMIEDQARKDASKAGIMKTTHLVTVAACFLPVTAPVAIAIGTGIQVTGTLAAKHQTNDPVSFGTLSDAVQNGYAKSKAFNDQTAKVKSAWDDLSKKHGILKEALKKDSDGKMDAARDFGQSASGFYQEIKSLYSIADVPTTEQYNESNAEKDDTVLQQQKRNQEKLSADQSALLATIADLADKNRKNQSQVLELSESREELLRADIRNDQDIAHWQSIALRLRADMYNELFREASILRRTLFYSTGENSNTDPDILSYSDEAFVTSLSYPGNSEIPDQVSSEWIKQQFAETRAKAIVAVNGLLATARRESVRANAKRTPKAIYLNATSLSINSKAGSPNRRFLDALNQQISDQVKQPDKSNEPIPLYVPLRIREALAKLPERFVDAVITEVKLEDEKALVGKNLNFSIYNPGFGTIVSGQQCFNVDMRITDVNSENRFFGYTTVGPLKHDWDQKLHANADAQSVQDRFLYARPPLHSAYYLTVQVDGSPDENNWTSIPVVTSLEITLLGVQ
jgi:hypothetical protein